MTIKEKLEKAVEPYKGSLKFIKEGMLKKQFSENIIKEIENNTSFLENVKLQERCYCILRNITERPVCHSCKGAVPFRPNEINGSRYGIHCSAKCSASNKSTQNKKRVTNLEKYGSINVLTSKAVVEKTKEKMLEKYGVENYTQSEEYKNRCEAGEFDTQAKKDSYIGLKETHLDIGYEKLQNKLKIKGNFEIITPREKYDGHYLTYIWKCLKCNTEFSQWLCPGYDLDCPQCNKGRGTKIERFIEDILLENKILYSKGSKSILKNSRQLDFYIPSLKLAIETNGLYWHSEEMGKDRNYHLDKLKECNELGIKLINIFEDEIRNKSLIVKSRIKNILGVSNTTIFARNCEVCDLEPSETVDFYNDNHIQGNMNSRISLGLKHNNILVAVISFTSLRAVTGNINTDVNEYELTRYATLSDCNIPGGFSRLLSYFKQKYNPSQIISYCDRRWSNGNMYKKNGFLLIKETEPNYWYISKDRMKRLHRYNFQKHLLKEKLDIFDPSLTEWQNMQNNNYIRVWDCGSLLFKWCKS